MLDGIAKVQSIVSTKTTLPILSNIHIEAVKGKLQLTATDLEVTVRTEVDADVGKKGTTTLPAKRIFSVVRELPSHDIEIEIDDKHNASIKCGGSFFKIVGIDPKDFPPLPELDTSHSYSLDQVTFTAPKVPDLVRAEGTRPFPHRQHLRFPARTAADLSSRRSA